MQDNPVHATLPSTSVFQTDISARPPAPRFDVHAFGLPLRADRRTHTPRRRSRWFTLDTGEAHVRTIKRGLATGAAVVLVAAGAFACGAEGGSGGGAGKVGADAAGAAGPITITWNLPDSMGLPVGDTTAASLPAAAAYAWAEFIALNWPAVPQTGALDTRDTPDTTAAFGAAGYTGPLVWHTFRSKVEIFPPAGTTPNGYSANAALSYGYDSLPRYTYTNPVPAYDSAQASAPVPWINLDENDEIGQDAMYAGVASGQRFPADLILFLAKANRSEYNYVAANQFFNTGMATPAFTASINYVVANRASPPAGSAQAASLPNGTIEIKSAWRRLTSTEASSGRFYTTTVRYYRLSQSGTDTTFQNDTLGMVALHIIHKTPNQPAFIYATFEQADNLLDSLGNQVEDVNGNVNSQYQGVPPMDSAIVSRNGQLPVVGVGYTTSNIQALSPDSSASVPGKRVYLRNSPRSMGFATTQGVIAVNRRIHSIPPEVVQANSNAHAAIAQYNATHGITSSPWQFYKLVNVQFHPIDKPQPGATYTGPDSATYYQSNSVVETNLNLQVFSGRFQPFFSDTAGAPVNTGGLITDFCGQRISGGMASYPGGCTDTGPFQNVRVGGHAYNMGGCMGCHGNAQLQLGSDFSFILSEINTASPQLADPVTAPNDVAKFFRIFRETAPPDGAPAARPATARPATTRR